MPEPHLPIGELRHASRSRLASQPQNDRCVSNHFPLSLIYSLKNSFKVCMLSRVLSLLRRSTPPPLLP